MAIINFNSISGVSTVTATHSVTVGDTFIKDSKVGLGTITTADRNAGVGTAIGTIVYNETSGEVQIYKRNAGWVIISNVGDNISGPLGLTATGGVVSDYSHPDGNVYRAHIFTASGTFEVSALSSSLPNNVDYLVVAGGGGGGSHAGGGGGGAGGLRTNVPGVVDAAANPLTSSAFPVSVTSYTVTIGAGGVGEPPPGNPNTGSNGGNSTFGPITSTGGGLGGGGSPGTTGNNGGSGGGAGGTGGAITAGSGNTPPISPPQGNNGGAGNVPVIVGGGGGGAGGVGGDWSPSPYRGGHGGAGVQVLISGPPTSNQLIGAPGPSGTGWFAGGGGGGTHQPGGTGGSGGGPGGPYAGGADGSGTSGSVKAPSATQGTGGGGGGAGGTNGAAAGGGGNGGSGIVAVRYQIGQTGTAKATGGAITFNGEKTIHQFTSSGTFTVTDSSLTSADILVVGGGGGGASRHGGGGGAGALIYRTGETVNPSPGVYTITVGSGGNGLYGAPGGTAVKGTNTTAFGFTAEGGGYGTSMPTGAGGAGGSGGGSRGNNEPPSPGGTASGAPGGTNGATSPPAGWGNVGGEGDPTPGNGGGGGGGAGGAGGAGSPTLAGSGGSGLSYNISGITTHYAGGGGGAYQPGWPLSANGTGGLGGGGQGGGDDLSAMQGHRGTGGGGGAGGDASPHPLEPTWGPKNGVPGGNGGSGIVLIAYPS